MNKAPQVKAFFDEPTNTFSYVVSDTATGACAIIDSVLNYDAASGATSTQGADAIIDFVRAENLRVEWILETHVHADHLTAAQYLKAQLGGKVAMSHNIAVVRETFGKIYNVDIAPDAKTLNAHQPFDYLFQDGEAFLIGELAAYNLPTPGHTPACLSYVIGDAVFVGDTLFMPDYGTARCDFPKGSASVLFDSVQKLYELPASTRVFLCHDYLPETRAQFQCESIIAEQRVRNIHIHDGVEKADFIAMREARDATLGMPKLILPSIQINMNAGQFPQPESNGVSYLKIPLNQFTR